MKESKRQAMGNSFSVLGVDFDFTESARRVVLGEKQTSTLEQLVTSAAASSLRGRLQNC